MDRNTITSTQYLGYSLTILWDLTQPFIAVEIVALVVVVEVLMSVEVVVVVVKVALLLSNGKISERQILFC